MYRSTETGTRVLRNDRAYTCQIRQFLIYEVVNTLSSAMSKIFSDRLKTARNLRGWNQAKLSEATNLQVSAISHFETGNRSPSFDNLRKIADALQVSTDYLIGRSDTP